MNRQDIVWILVRATGFWMLALSLQMLPSLFMATPEIINILLSWDMLMESGNLQTLLSHGPLAHSVSIISKLAVYLISALYLIGRGEGLIAAINRRS
ncbi:hypothetical protein [Parendozoicomonas sp. Alg238-R29]|uniref:hypothetical protein n=1 Tax=Parendozoicomonas sp. Alg238-R29 TaxID=2993446 RepID=UPI00248D4DE6|nr:hypothetical protein [Parendozoicomonas sp. Alg238-R29]